jgi:hypothetical protein
MAIWASDRSHFPAFRHLSTCLSDILRKRSVVVLHYAVTISGFKSGDAGSKCNTMICSGHNPMDSNVRPSQSLNSTSNAAPSASRSFKLLTLLKVASSRGLPLSLCHAYAHLQQQWHVKIMRASEP